MDRRCIICGLEPDDQCVYPRNMAEAKRWQNLAKLDSFNVDTEALCKHGCVCALHLDTEQEYGSILASTPDAVCSPRHAGGKISHSPDMKWCCLKKGWCQSGAPPYPTTMKANSRMQMKSKQNRDSMAQANSNVDRCNIGLHRCRAAQIRGNLYSQMRKNCYRQQSTGTSPDRSLKQSQTTVPVICASINYPIPRESNAVSKEASCPLKRSRSPAPTSSTCKCTSQRSSKNSQKISQPRPRSCDRLPSLVCNQQQFQSSNDSNSSQSSSTGQSSPTTSESQCTCKCSCHRSPKYTQTHTQQKPRSCDRLPSFEYNKQQLPSSDDRNLNYSIPRNSNAVSEKTCSPAPAPFTCKCSRQRSPKNTQTHTQQRPRSCDRLPCFACNKQKFQSSNDFNSSQSSSTGQSCSTTSESQCTCKCSCSCQRSPKYTQTHTQQRPRSCDRLQSFAYNKQQLPSSDDRNLNYPIPRNSNAVSEKTCSPAPAPFTCKCSRQRSPKNTQTHTQQRPRSCDRLPCFACNKQKFPSSDDRNLNYPIPINSNAVSGKSCSPAPAPYTCKFSRQRSPKNIQTCSQQRPRSQIHQKYQSSDDFPNSSTGQSCSITCESHQGITPEVKDKYCQTSINCQLKDQEVQCSEHSLQPDDPLAAVTARNSTRPKEISITEICECNRSASLATRSGRGSYKSTSCTANIELPNFEYAGEDQQYSVNAVNVLLMNGSRQKPYDGPNPEIRVQQSDLADCNERAVFPEVDKPTYRVCRAATSGPNTQGQQDEANVLVLEEGLMSGCSPEEYSHQGQSESEQQFVEGIYSNQNQSIRCTDQGIELEQFGDNWIKVLELQRARINELDNLLQQHNKLQQTIQARMTELQCQDNVAEKAK